MKEFDLIQWICSQASASPTVEVGPGDDCAVLRVGGEQLLITVDQVLDGVHFVLSRDGPAAGGRKAVARNLSDIAAMGGEPLAMVASVALPMGFDDAQAKELYDGMRRIGEQHACPLVGGDISAWNRTAERLQISVTVLGLCRGVGPVLRSTARPGDVICVTGALGAAWRTARHLNFTPRLREGRVLARDYAVSAMIDISDGLAADLGHIAAMSGVGAVLDALAVPVHPDATAACQRAVPGGQPVRHGQTQSLSLPIALEMALYDGEDYELLFTLPPEQADRLLADQQKTRAGLPALQGVPDHPFDVPVSRIGVIRSEPGLFLDRAGRLDAIEPRGWEHST